MKACQGMNDSSDKRPSPPRHTDTRIVTAGRHPPSYHGFINPPVYHASTLVYPSAEEYVAQRGRYQYGRIGTPTTDALESALAELEGPQCAGVALLPSGLAAISTALLTALKAGDHLLVTDNAYGPTRAFCEQILSRFGIGATFYDPMIGDAIAAQFQPNTRAIYLESPGSLSFEMQDVDAIAKIAHDKGALVLMDNTWATPVYFRPLDHGADLVIQSGTKYIGGHSDVMLGTVSANAAHVAALKQTTFLYGLCEGPDDVYLGLRGLRTLAVRTRTAFQIGTRGRTLARTASRSSARAAPRLAQPPRPRPVAAGFHRRIRPVQRRTQAGIAESGLCVPRCAHIVRHWPVVGRLREPCNPVRPCAGAHRDQVVAGRPHGALPYRS